MQNKHDSNIAACAHMKISYRTEQVDPPYIRGWWECDSNCGTKFTPANGSFMAMIFATCQYSRLVKWQTIKTPESPMKRRKEMVRTIQETALEWDMKPGAVYLRRKNHEHTSMYMNTSSGVPVGIANIPEGYYLLTDGQELGE